MILSSDKSKAFLKRGDGRLGTTMPLGASMVRPTKRTLQLQRPQSASFPDNSIDEEEQPRTYTEIYARHTAPRPTPLAQTAANRQFANGRKSDVDKQQGDKEAAALLLMGMDDGIFGEDAHRRSTARDTSSLSLPARRGVGASQLKANHAPSRNMRAASTSPPRRVLSPGRGVAHSTVVDHVVAAEMERGILRKRMEGWYASATNTSEGDILRSRVEADAGDGEGHGKVVDFSPVLQALQGKLAALTQENITLRESVRELEEGMATVQEHYEQRLKEAMANVTMEKKMQVRSVVQSIRVRERQERAMHKFLTTERQHEEIRLLQRELRSAKQDALATEGVLTMTIEKLKRDKVELQERLRVAVEDPQRVCPSCATLRERCSELEAQLLRFKAHKGDTWRSPPRGRTSAERQRRNASSPPKTNYCSREVAPQRKEVPLSDSGDHHGYSASDSPPPPNHMHAKETSVPISPAPSRQPPRQQARMISSPSGNDQVAGELRVGSRVRGESKDNYTSDGDTEARTRGHSDFGGKPRASAADSEGDTSGHATPASLSTTSSPSKPRPSAQRTLANGAIEVCNGDGSKTITFKDGTVKEFTTDGRLVVRFCNGDVKEECPDGTVTYFYREARTTHITYKNGLQLLHFPDNQMEKHYPDGSKEVLFPDKTRRRFRPNGTEELEAWV